jgi:hypothetical protein
MIRQFQKITAKLILKLLLMNYFCAKTHHRLLLLFACLFLFANESFTRNDVRISINNGNITIKEALREIERQSNLSVAYNESKLNGYRHIRLIINNQPLDKALKAILTGTGFDFRLEEEYIIIVPKQNKQTGNQPVLCCIMDEYEESLPDAYELSSAVITSLGVKRDQKALKNQITPYTLSTVSPYTQSGKKAARDLIRRVQPKRLPTLIPKTSSPYRY